MRKNDTSASYHLPDALGEMLGRCWCDSAFLWLPAEWVRDARTRSCGAPSCHEERKPLPAKGREGTGDAVSPTLRAGPAPVPAPSKGAA